MKSDYLKNTINNLWDTVSKNEHYIIDLFQFMGNDDVSLSNEVSETGPDEEKIIIQNIQKNNKVFFFARILDFLIVMSATAFLLNHVNPYYYLVLLVVGATALFVFKTRFSLVLDYSFKDEQANEWETNCEIILAVCQSGKTYARFCEINDRKAWLEGPLKTFLLIPEGEETGFRVSANCSAVCVKSPRYKVLFLPDRLLIKSKNYDVESLRYSQIEVVLKRYGNQKGQSLIGLQFINDKLKFDLASGNNTVSMNNCSFFKEYTDRFKTNLNRGKKETVEAEGVVEQSSVTEKHSSLDDLIEAVAKVKALNQELNAAPPEFTIRVDAPDEKLKTDSAEEIDKLAKQADLLLQKEDSSYLGSVAQNEKSQYNSFHRYKRPFQVSSAATEAFVSFSSYRKPSRFSEVLTETREESTDSEGNESVGLPVVVDEKQIIAPVINEQSPYTVPIAMGTNDTLFYEDLKEVSHLLVIGAKEAGKTSLVQSIVLMLAERCGYEGVRFYCFNSRMTEYDSLSCLPSMVNPINFYPDQVETALARLSKEMIIRMRILSRTRCRDIDSFWKLGGRLPHIYVIFDDYASFGFKDDNERTVLELLRNGRAIGIHCILVTASVREPDLPKDVSGSIPFRAVFTVATKNESKRIIGMSGAETLVNPGEMIYKGNGKMIRCKSAEIIPGMVEPAVNKMRQRDLHIEGSDNSRINWNPESMRRKTVKESFDSNTIRSVIRVADECFMMGKADITLLRNRLRMRSDAVSSVVAIMEGLGLITHPYHDQPGKLLMTLPEWLSFCYENDLLDYQLS